MNNWFTDNKKYISLLLTIDVVCLYCLFHVFKEGTMIDIAISTIPVIPLIIKTIKVIIEFIKGE